MSTTIGSADTAARLGVHGGEYGDGPGAADREAPWDHARLRELTEERARSAGGVFVASGGTSGTPKLTVMAPDLGVPGVVAHWRPLGPGDVLLNLFSTGRMWGAHYFYNALATACHGTVAPMGALHPEEFGQWVDIIRDMRVNALAGAPNVLARFAGAALAAGVELPVRAVLWAGEPMTRARAATLGAAFPEAGLWGNYGSIETFVIGTSRPGCRLGTLHLLPGQLLELEDDGALLTRVGDGWPAPARRFRLGDRLRAAACPCGTDDAFEVVGRADDNVKLCGGMVSLGEVHERAGRVDGVDDTQLVCYHDPEVPSAVLAMRLRYTGRHRDAAALRAVLVGAMEDLELCDRHTPEAFTVEHVAEVERSPRTHKVLPVVWRPAGDLAGVAGGVA
ncbi:AMP-binding protein [Streptomyces sp. NPDC049879]|uniref:AMP-binding protein n=1 Tax=Streptomyces sp. NPDC049879 TaxID=3365598 RepID=UPI0037BD0A28